MRCCLSVLSKKNIVSVILVFVLGFGLISCSKYTTNELLFKNDESNLLDDIAATLFGDFLDDIVCSSMESNGFDTDGDCVADTIPDDCYENGDSAGQLADGNGDGVIDCFEEFPDEDGNGVPDILEDPENFSDEMLQSAPDKDGDGLNDIIEYSYGSDPALADTDGDGIDDNVEVLNGTNPALADSDGDGLDDNVDSCPAGVAGWTSSLQTDHDGDGCQDSSEDVDDDSDGVCDSANTTAAAALAASCSVVDGGDLCPQGVINWDETGGVDSDNDGCEDAQEDLDLDGDGVCDQDVVITLGQCESVSGGDSNPTNQFVCSDEDGDGCDDCSSGTYNPANDGLDTDGDGLCNSGDADDDGDGVCDVELTPAESSAAGCVSFSGGDSNALNATVCGDTDSDGCDDCSSGNYDVNNDGLDTDSDGVCNSGDVDDDGDGIEDGSDDCPIGNTGWVSTALTDHDGDGCQDSTAEDADKDNDGVLDVVDSCEAGAIGWASSNSGCGAELYDEATCNDNDGDGCKDNVEDSDDDNDGQPDVSDSNNFSSIECIDADGDNCDDCAITGVLASATNQTSPDSDNDGADWDGDGDCNVGDADDDNDDICDGADTVGTVAGEDCVVGFNSVDACQESIANNNDNTAPDFISTNSDCSNGYNATTCTDYTKDGCEDGIEDNDDDKDGVVDSSDRCDPEDGQASHVHWVPSNQLCSGAVYHAADCNDYDLDGCEDNIEDVDDDGDGVCDAVVSQAVAALGDCVSLSGGDLDATNPAVCSDSDGDGCEDCVSGVYQPTNDGPDLDGDGLCNAGDADDDGDGLADGNDSCPLGETGWISSSCQQFTFFVHANGKTYLETINSCFETDNDGDGCADSGEDTDDDNDGILDSLDNCKDLANIDQANTDEQSENANNTPLVGDSCDVDLDGDGKQNVSDVNPDNPTIY